MKSNKFSFFAVAILFFSISFCTTSWTQWNLADTTFQSASEVAFPHVNAAYLTTDMGILYKSVDRGVTWGECHSFGVFSSLRSPRFISKDTGFVSANYGIQRTFDGGQTWTNVVMGSFYTPSSFSVNEQAIVIAFQNFTNDTMYVKKSTDYGTTFVTMMAKYNPNLSGFSVTFINDMIGFVINSSELSEFYKTTDGGSSFDTIQILNGPISLEEKFLFHDEQNGYLYGGMGSQANATRTWNGGTSFFDLGFDGFNVLPVIDLTFNTGKLYGTTLYGKIYTSLNNGQFWTEQTTPVANEVTSISFANEFDGIAVSRNQIIYTNNGGGTLGIDKSQNPQMIIYPNPANNKIEIQSQFSYTDNAELIIYNVSGKIVMHLPFQNKVNIESLGTGVYIVLIKRNGSIVAREKLIIDSSH